MRKKNITTMYVLFVLIFVLFFLKGGMTVCKGCLSRNVHCKFRSNVCMSVRFCCCCFFRAGAGRGNEFFFFLKIPMSSSVLSYFVRFLFAVSASVLAAGGLVVMKRD